MVALRRGLMLLISASPTSCGPLVSLSRPLFLSSSCRPSPWQQKEQSVGPPGRRIAPSGAPQIPSLWPISGIHACAVNSRRSCHESSLANERQGLESRDEGFRTEYVRASEKRLGWKRTPIFGFPDTPWQWNDRRLQRNRRESVGNGHGSIWDGGGGGGGGGGAKISSRASSNSTDGATTAGQSFGEASKTVKEIKQRENGDQRRPTGNRNLKSSEGTASNGSFVDQGGNRRSSDVHERPPRPPFAPRANNSEELSQSRGKGDGKSSQEASGRPPFKPKANYYEKLAQSKGERDGRSSHANGRPPLKPKANYYEKRAQSTREGDAGSSQARRSLPFKPKANYYEKLAQSRGDGGGGSSLAGGSPPFKPNANYSDKLAQSRGEGEGRSSQTSGRPPLKPKANYYDKLAQNRGAEGDGSSSKASGRPPFKPKANYYDNRRDGSSPKPPYEEAHRRNEKREDGPHFGYKFRKGGPELGQFRRISPQDGGPAAADSQGKRAQIRESGAVRNFVNAKEKSPEEETERKYHPRRLEGEKKWQYSVRKKQLGLAGHTRGSTRKVALQFVDNEGLGDEPQGDDWRRKKTAWLCKEIPALRPRPLVTILNEQRKWINAEDTKYIIEHHLQIDQTLRAHRVLKWEMQQPWYEFDYELSSKVAVQLGQNNKLSRTRDIYDLIIKNGKVPDLSTYDVLINCYIVDGENTAMTQAWSLYNQMSQLGGHEPPPTLSYNLFQGLAQKGLTFLDQADDLFKRIKTSGLVCSTEMYSLLIHSHGTKGNNDRVDQLINEMKGTGLPVGQDVYSAILRSCAKDGNVAVGEQAFADLKRTGHKLIPSVYSSLIKMYGKAGLPEKAFQTFQEMRETGTSPNLTVYEPMIEAAVLSGKRDQAETLLREAQERRTPSLHFCYNSVMELYSKSGLLDDLDRLFNEMEAKGYPPNQASYNVLLEAYARNRLLEKAEAVYEIMKSGGKAKPNKRTYELMIKIYGEAKKHEQLKEVFKELADKKLDVPEEAKRYLEAAVSPKQLEAHRNAKLKLKREQREILAGVLLAGAGVESHDRNRTYEVHFGLNPDSEVGLPLINHLYQQFSDWSTGPPNRQPLPNPKDPQRSKMLLAFQTVSHGSLRFFAHQYRPSRSPVIPRLVHRWLTPRALAYWYMYGGSKCPQTGDILLNAAAYSDKEIMLVVNALKARTIDCEKKGSGSGLVICFNGRSAIWLWGLMEPYILPEVKSLLNPEIHGREDLMQQL